MYFNTIKCNKLSAKQYVNHLPVSGINADASKDRTGTEKTEQKIEQEVKVEGIPTDKPEPTQTPPPLDKRSEYTWAHCIG